MTTDEPEDLTGLLNRAARGDADAVRHVFPAVYQELRDLAARKRRHRLPAGATLQTTALVHEAYVRIVRTHPAGWESIRHFYFTAARAMRDILVEEARRKTSLKRGGDRDRVPLDEDAWIYDQSPEEVLALDAALARLEREDAEGHQLVFLRFYAGLNAEEIAEVLGTSLRTIERKWRFLRVWLMRELGAVPASGLPG